MKIRVKEKIISAITVCLLTAALCACTQDSSGELESAGETNEATVQETASEEASAVSATAEETPSAETSEAETTASSPSVLTGEFVGWADNHTVEIIVDGEPAAFQVEDEEVKAALEALETSADAGSDFSFEMVQNGEVRKIVGVIQE